MKTKPALLVTAALLFAVSVSVSSQDAESEIDALVEKWIQALGEADIEAFMECYWDDAIRLMYGPGTATMDEGVEQIRSVQLELFEQRDFAAMDFPYDPIQSVFPDGGRPTYFVANSAWGYMEIFEFERRVGEYRIIKQYVLPHPGAE